MKTSAISTPPGCSTIFASRTSPLPTGSLSPTWCKPIQTERHQVRRNKRFSDAKLRKKISSKVGDPLDERKLFTDTQEILKLYRSEHATFGGEICGERRRSRRARMATFEIKEAPRWRIIEVDFPGAQAFPKRNSAGSSRRASTGCSRGLPEAEAQGRTDRGRQGAPDAVLPRQRLYDFEIKDIQYDHPSPTRLIVRFQVYEGVQYKVGSVKFTGNQLFSLQELTNGFPRVQKMRGTRVKAGPNGLPMDVGDTFTPRGLTRDVETVEDFYGARGYVDVSSFGRNLVVNKIPIPRRAPWTRVQNRRGPEILHRKNRDSREH